MSRIGKYITAIVVALLLILACAYLLKVQEGAIEEEEPFDAPHGEEYLIDIYLNNQSQDEIETLELGIMTGDEGEKHSKLNESVYLNEKKKCFSISYAPDLVFYLKGYFKEGNKECVCGYFSLEEKDAIEQPQSVTFDIQKVDGEWTLLGEDVTVFEKLPKERTKAGIIIGETGKFSADYAAPIEGECVLKESGYVTVVPEGKTGCLTITKIHQEMSTGAAEAEWKLAQLIIY